jgi:hypothetical protein
MVTMERHMERTLRRGTSDPLLRAMERFSFSYRERVQKCVT